VTLVKSRLQSENALLDRNPKRPDSHRKYRKWIRNGVGETDV